MSDDLDEFVELDRQVDAAESDGIWARWKFGRKLLVRRKKNGGKQLPHHLLDDLVAKTNKSRRELMYRAQFAEQFPTKAKVRNALRTYGSWHEIVNRALPRLPKPPEDTPDLPDDIFRTIVADPPWKTAAGPAEFGGGAKSQALEYAAMDIDAIAALPIAKHAANNAHLYLWTTNHYLDDAYDVIREWNFEPSTVLTWCKKPHGLGLGGAYVLTTEFVVFARRGTLEPRRRVHTTWFDWPRRRGHSVKPREFFDMVETVSPGPYLELFNRGGRDGWTVWGAEAMAA